MTTTNASPARHRWELVTARDLMRTDVVTLRSDAPLSEIEETLGEHGISGAPVVDATGRIVGVLSMKDLIARYAEDPETHRRREEGFYRFGALDDDPDVVQRERARSPDDEGDTASELMTSDVFSVDANASLSEIAKEMADRKIHRVIVHDHGKYVGLISTMEVLNALTA